MENGNQLNGEVLQILAECCADSAKFCKFFFPDSFYRSFSTLHSQIFKVFDDPSIRQAVIVAPRGIGKTSISSLAIPAKALLFKEHPYIVTVSATASSAILQSENLKTLLLSNDVIKRIFGDLKGATFTKEFWTYNSGAIMPRGAEQQIRGLLYNSSRPSLIIGDDLESSEAVMSPDQREKLWNWFIGDVCNAIDRGSKNWKIVVIGTILHHDSLISRLLEHPDWHPIHLSICDKDMRSLWPEFISDDELLKLKSSFEVSGNLSTFSREYLSVPYAVSEKDFCASDFRFFKEQFNCLTITNPEDSTQTSYVELSKLFSFVLVDPAKTVSYRSAETGIVGVSVDISSGYIFVRRVSGERLAPDQIYSVAISMAFELSASYIGIEVTSLDLFITQPFQCALARVGAENKLILVPLKAVGDKLQRIRELSSYYKGHHVFHNEDANSGCVKLESQLLDFPFSKRVDCCDAFAYISVMFEKLNISLIGNQVDFVNIFQSPIAQEEYQLI